MKIQTCLHSYRKNINQISTLGFCIASQSDKKSSSISKWPLQNPSPYGSIPSNIVGSSNESISELPQGTPLNKHGTQQLWLFSGFPSMFFHVMFFHFISMSFESLIMCYFSRCGVFHGFPLKHLQVPMSLLTAFCHFSSRWFPAPGLSHRQVSSAIRNGIRRLFFGGDVHEIAYGYLDGCYGFLFENCIQKITISKNP